MLKPVNDDIENAMYFRHETEDNQWQVGIHPVLYGVRIRAGRVGSASVLADICIGNNQAMFDFIFPIVCGIIQERGYVPNEWPEYERRPVWLDTSYIGRLTKMLQDISNIEKYEIPDLEEIRVNNLRKYFGHEESPIT